MSADLVLTERYRPHHVDYVYGQERAVQTLLHTIENGLAHSFLLYGPTGTGKTTLARIACDLLAAEMDERDAASHTGVDAMRQALEQAHYMPIEYERRGFIFDEAHRLSPQAWDTCLKLIEEPPGHVFFFFVTTMVQKVPKTIRNRCVELKLTPVAYDALIALLTYVAEAENFDIQEGVLDLCAREAHGSPRRALVLLGQVTGLDLFEARKLLIEPEAKEPLKKLCRGLIDGTTWLQAMECVANITDEAEDIRIAVNNYLAKVAKEATSDRATVQALNVMEQFAEPYHPGENQAPLLRSIGRCIYKG